jgi:hypothetical protein
MLSPKGCDNIAWGNAPGLVGFVFQAESLRHSFVAALQAAISKSLGTQGVALGYVVAALQAENIQNYAKISLIAAALGSAIGTGRSFG